MTATHSKRKLKSAISATQTASAAVQKAAALVATDPPEELPADVEAPLENAPQTLGLRYSCDACFKDISGIVRIQCVECQDLDLCVECFAAGVEGSSTASSSSKAAGGLVVSSGCGMKHIKTHSYRVIPPLDFVLFKEDKSGSLPWRADEELLLVEGMEVCGVGNWDGISQHVGTRTPSQCQEHYTRVYLDSSEFPISSKTHIRQLETSEPTSYPSSLLERVALGLPEMPPSPPACTEQSVPANHDIYGYMPLRHDFETEHENEAEMVLKDLAFIHIAGDESPSCVEEDESLFAIQCKLALLHGYTGVLDRRQARKSFLMEYKQTIPAAAPVTSFSLLEFKKISAAEKARTKEERSLHNAMRPFARFMDPRDYDVLQRDILREDVLRKRIIQLHDYRRNGIRTFKDAAAFDSEKKNLV